MEPELGSCQLSWVRVQLTMAECNLSSHGDTVLGLGQTPGLFSCGLGPHAGLAAGPFHYSS